MSKQSKIAKKFEEDCDGNVESAYAKPADTSSSNIPKSGKTSAVNQAEWVEDLQSNVLVAVRSALINSEPKPDSARTMPKFDLDFAASDDAASPPQPTKQVSPPQPAAVSTPRPAPVERRRAPPPVQKTASSTSIQRPPAAAKAGEPLVAKPLPTPTLTQRPARPDDLALESFSRSAPVDSPAQPGRQGAVFSTDAPADLVRDLERALSVPPRVALGETSPGLSAGVPLGSPINQAVRGFKTLKAGLPQWGNRRNSVEALGLIAITTFAVSGVFFYLAPHEDRSSPEVVRVASVDAGQSTPSPTVPATRQDPDDDADVTSSIATLSVSTPSVSAGENNVLGDIVKSEDETRKKADATVTPAKKRVAKLTTTEAGTAEVPTESSTTTKPVQQPIVSNGSEAQAAARVALKAAIGSDPFYSGEVASAEALAATKALYTKAGRLGGTDLPQLVMVLKAGNKNAITAVASQFLSRARTLLSQGKVREARALLKLVEGADRSEVALALGRSFDPNYLSSLGDVNAEPSPEDAERWYRRWFDLSVQSGQVSADVDIERLIRAIN